MPLMLGDNTTASRLVGFGTSDRKCIPFKTFIPVMAAIRYVIYVVDLSRVE